MIQEYIVWMILAAIVGYLIYSGIKSYRSKNSPKCSGCCGCGAKEQYDLTVKQKKNF